MQPTLTFPQRPVHPPFVERVLLVVAALFVAVQTVALSLVDSGRVAPARLLVPGVWLLLMAAAHIVLGRFRPRHDPFLLPVFAMLTGWGLVLQDRLAPNFLLRQTAWVAVGTALLLVVAVLPRTLQPLRQYRYTVLVFGLILLALTFVFGVNPSGYGAALWLPVPLLGSIYFQPSELLKLLFVFFFASYFADRGLVYRDSIGRGRWAFVPYLAPLLLMWGFCVLLLVWQRDLGAATLFFILFLALLYVATGQRAYVLGGFVMLLAAGVIGYVAFDVVALRVDAWLNPWPDYDDRAFQIVQSLYALAAGSVGGSGIGQGFPDYIPVVHSDFVLAAITEEWGLIGALALIVCFALLTQRGLRIALLARRAFPMYVTVGITVLLSAQTLLIMGGVAKLVPLTGVTLPFVSYGGSSMVLGSVMVGLLLYLSDRASEG